MDVNTLKDYFNTYIKPFFPYADNRLYSTLIDYISNNLLDHLYNDVPSLMRHIFEDNQIPSEIYDQLLIAIGVHKEVIQKLTLTDKEIFLKALSDFQRYKGSIKFFQNVPQAYDEKFGIYELWVDYDTDINDWVLKPYLIYKPQNYDSEYNDPLSYEEVYNEVPTLLVSPEKLNIIKSNRDAIFPIKTNLVLLQYNSDLDINTLKLLKISLFIKEYGHNIIPIYLQGKIINLSITHIYFFWYYLITYLYNTSFEISSVCYLVQFLSTEDTVYTLQPTASNNIEDLENEFKRAKSTHEIHNIYYEKIEKIYGHLYTSTDKITAETMQQYIVDIVPDFLTYMETRIANSTKTKKLVITDMLDEIYNSLLSYKHIDVNVINDTVFNKYFDLFLSSLPQLIIQPKKTTTYTLLYNFKPYHVELIDKSVQTLTSKDVLDTVVALDKFEMALNFWIADALVVSDTNTLDIQPSYTSNVTLVSDYKWDITGVFGTSYILDDKFLLDSVRESVDALVISDIPYFDMEIPVTTSIILSDENKNNITIEHTDSIFINDMMDCFDPVEWNIIK